MNAVTPSLTLVRRLKAPPDRVWQAWTDPAILAQWFGPHHTRVAEAEASPAYGFRIVLREENGLQHEVRGTYTAVEPPHRLVFDWAWTATPERVSRVTVALRPVPDGTELTLTHDRFADEATATRHTRGWTESLERLVALHAQ